jgi:adhesin transport system outer membrane protein
MRVLAALPFLLVAAVSAHGQTLAEAIQNALEVHPEIQSGVHARLAVEDDLRVARAGYLPQVDLQAGYGREGTDSPSSRNDSGRHGSRVLDRGESSLTVQQMLFDGFATQSEVARQRSTVNARAYALLADSELTGLTVVQSYLDVLLYAELVQLAEDNLNSHVRIHDQIVLRSKSGVGRMADLDQAEARVAQARNNVFTEQTNLEDAKVTYASVVGLEPTGLSLPSSIRAQVPESLSAAREELLANNASLSSAESDVQAAEAQYSASKSSFYPRFDLELSRDANSDIDGVDGHYNEWQAMVRMRYSLYAGGGNSANVRSKAHLVNQAMDIRNNALRQLNEEIGLAWNALQNYRAQLPIAQQYVDRSASVRQSYQKQFSLGERTLLDLLDSENEYFSAARRLAEVRFSELYTHYRIKATTGTLLRSQGVSAPIAALPLDVVKPDVQLPKLN